MKMTDAENLPWINLSTTSPAKLSTLDPIAVITMKMRNDDMYAMLRPTLGISDIGLRV